MCPSRRTSYPTPYTLYPIPYTLQENKHRTQAYLIKSFEKDPHAAPSLHDGHLEYLAEHRDEKTLLHFLTFSGEI